MTTTRTTKDTRKALMLAVLWLTGLSLTTTELCQVAGLKRAGYGNKIVSELAEAGLIYPGMPTQVGRFVTATWCHPWDGEGMDVACELSGLTGDQLVVMIEDNLKGRPHPYWWVRTPAQREADSAADDLPF